MKEEKVILDKNVLDALQDAIEGEIFESLRGVTVEWDNNKLKMIAYIDGQVTDQAVEHLNDIETYFLSHMPDDCKSNVRIVQCNFPAEMKPLRYWIYKK
jgi:hypothetical protein